MKTTTSSKQLLVISCTAILLLLVQTASSTYLDKSQTVCSRASSHTSCIMGCYKCAITYGRKAYDMGSCCAECQATKAYYVDDGPDECSTRFFSQSLSGYLKAKRSID